MHVLAIKNSVFFSTTEDRYKLHTILLVKSNVSVNDTVKLNLK